MIFIINPPAGTYSVDGVERSIPMTYLDEDIVLITFNSNTGVGLIEYNPALDPPIPDEPIGKAKFDAYGWLLSYWKAAAPPPPRTLEEAKADKKKQMDSRRTLYEHTTFEYLNKPIATDPLSLSRVAIATFSAQNAIAINDTGFEIEWPCKDGTIITLTAQEMIDMTTAMATLANGLYLQAKARYAEIDAATTIEEVDAVEW